MLLLRLYWAVLPCQFPTGRTAPSRLMFTHVQNLPPVLFHTEQMSLFIPWSRRSSEPVQKYHIFPDPSSSVQTQNRLTGQSWYAVMAVGAEGAAVAGAVSAADMVRPTAAARVNRERRSDIAGSAFSGKRVGSFRPTRAVGTSKTTCEPLLRATSAARPPRAARRPTRAPGHRAIASAATGTHVGRLPAE